jgi:hypothetical protein
MAPEMDLAAGMNPQPSPSEGGALSLSYARMVTATGLEPAQTGVKARETALSYAVEMEPPERIELSPRGYRPRRSP